MLAAPAIAVVLAVIMAQRIVRPIEALALSAQAISGGDFSQRVEVSGQDEIADLSRAFNSMSSQLQQSLIGLEQEIAERRQVEEALRESEQRLRSIIEHSPDGILLLDESGIIIEWNPAAERITGIQRNEAIGNSLWDIQFRMAAQEWQTPENHEQLKGRVLDLLQTGQAPWLNRALETEVYQPDGTRRTLQTLTFLIETDHGYRAGSMLRDVTQRKQAEEEIHRLNDELELRVAERTAELIASNQELEDFAYLVSHDLRAPLRGINGFSYALLEEYGDSLDATGQEYLHRVRAASERMGQFIDSLLRLSRLTRSEIQHEMVDLTHLAQEIAWELRRRDPQRRADFAIQEGMSAYGDAQSLRSVLENLLENSWKFSRKRKQAKIEFGCNRIADTNIYFVRDNGVGFDMAYANKLFGAFQHLHGIDEFEGNGMGLAIVERVVQRHGGRVWAEGIVDQGATFHFTIADKRGEEEE
jgi:PAS domain S-box-containing protein